MSQSEYLTLRQLSKLLGESKATTQRRVTNKEITTVKLDGDLGTHLVPRAVAEKLLRAKADELAAELADINKELTATAEPVPS